MALLSTIAGNRFITVRNLLLFTWSSCVRVCGCGCGTGCAGGGGINVNARGCLYASVCVHVHACVCVNVCVCVRVCVKGTHASGGKREG